MVFENDDVGFEFQVWGSRVKAVGGKHLEIIHEKICLTINNRDDWKERGNYNAHIEVTCLSDGEECTTSTECLGGRWCNDGICQRH